MGEFKLQQDSRIRPDIPEIDLKAVNQYCIPNNRYLSNWMFALSTLLPEAEMFFNAVIAKTQPYVANDDLIQRMNLLVKQEANHLKVHNQWNNEIKKRMKDTSFLNARIKFQKEMYLKILKDPKVKYYELVYRLNLGETFTETLSTFLLDKLLDDLTPQERKMWGWHSIEEIEHAHVCHELTSLVPSPTRFMKIKMTLLSVLMLFGETTIRAFNISWTDGLFKNPRFYLELLTFTFGPKKGLPAILMTLVAGLLHLKSEDPRTSHVKFLENKESFL